MRSARLQERIQQQEQQKNEDQSEEAIYFDDIPDEEVTLEPNDTIKNVEESIIQFIEEDDQEMIHEFRAKQRVLYKNEIARVSEALVKKNQILNETLDSQEKLTLNAIQQKEQIDEA